MNARNMILGTVVLLGGAVVMVLEIAGVRFLQPLFGSAFYVWTSQIGVVMLALAMGYAVGGRLADRWERAWCLGAILAPVGLGILTIPSTRPMLQRIADWHAKPVTFQTHAENEDAPPPALDPELMKQILQEQGETLPETTPTPKAPTGEPETAVPPIWQKINPALGSALVFLLPCMALGMISPYMIRLSARRVAHVGTISGVIYAASTVGSIVGVFVTAYVLIEWLAIPRIFQVAGGLTLALAGLCWSLDRFLDTEDNNDNQDPANDSDADGADGGDDRAGGNSV